MFFQQDMADAVDLLHCQLRVQRKGEYLLRRLPGGRSILPSGFWSVCGSRFRPAQAAVTCGSRFCLILTAVTCGGRFRPAQAAVTCEIARKRIEIFPGKNPVCGKKLRGLIPGILVCLKQDRKVGIVGLHTILRIEKPESLRAAKPLPIAFRSLLPL